MYTVILPYISSLFFALNHPNYARGSIRYHYNLLQLENTHPEVYKDFKNRSFDIKISNRPFSGILVNLTLEQTINVNSASQCKVINYITD